MGRIITVHGTFAHMGEAGQPVDDLPWWKPGSAFSQRILALVQRSGDAHQAPVEYEAFVWSGDNSEVARRAAGQALLERLDQLEKTGERYSLIGHSHGGSVIANALIRSASRRRGLPGLESWITVGTPFVELRKIANFFERLNLIKKVVLVASLMLFLMFLCFFVGQLIRSPGEAETLLSVRTLLAALMMIMPALIVTALLWLIDWYGLIFYRRETIVRARTQFQSRWTSLWHSADEAVQGLMSLRQANKLTLFAPNFAVARMTFFAAFALPIIYILMVTSPPTMNAIAVYLKDNVYEVDKTIARAQEFEKNRQKIRDMVAAMTKPATAAASSAQVKTDWSKVRQARRELTAQYPDHAKLTRALRFKRDFMTDSNKPCPDNTFCYSGHSFAYNSKLLYHIVTDEATSSLVNDDTRYGIWSALVGAVIPMVLVPIAAISIALLLTLLVRWVAIISSRVLSGVLNGMTLAELKREIYGNDTEGEEAVGSGPRPPWLPAGAPHLPTELADRITERANAASAASLAKFRNAISEIVLAEGRPRDSGIVSRFLTWRELVHTSYFDLPEFSKLVARALVGGSLAPSAAFTADPEFARATAWLSEVRPADASPQS